MKNVVYVTGNPNKAKYFSQMVGIEIDHKKIETEEIQSLDLRKIVEHKARQAYEQTALPVLIEDTKLSFDVFGNLPGPFVKWFGQELGDVGLCKLLDGHTDRGARAGATIAYFDGSDITFFERELAGTIAVKPKGDGGFGWNSIFIPNGSELTLGEMNDEQFRRYYAKIKPFDEVAEFLRELDKH